MSNIDHEAALQSLIAPEVSMPVYQGDFVDGDPDDVIRVMLDGGFEAGLEYGGAENRQDDAQVIIRSTDYQTAKDATQTIRSEVSPSDPEDYQIIKISQPFRPVRQDGDDRTYFSGRFRCRIHEE